MPKNLRENEDYLNAFRTMLSKRGELTEYVPLDLNDLNWEGYFVTSTGKPVEWFNWQPSQPNNYRNEDYVYMRGNDGQWNDISAEKRSDFPAYITVFCELN